MTIQRGITSIVQRATSLFESKLTHLQKLLVQQREFLFEKFPPFRDFLRLTQHGGDFLGFFGIV